MPDTDISPLGRRVRRLLLVLWRVGVLKSMAGGILVWCVFMSLHISVNVLDTRTAFTPLGVHNTVVGYLPLVMIEGMAVGVYLVLLERRKPPAIVIGLGWGFLSGALAWAVSELLLWPHSFHVYHTIIFAPMGWLLAVLRGVRHTGKFMILTSRGVAAAGVAFASEFVYGPIIAAGAHDPRWAWVDLLLLVTGFLCLLCAVPGSPGARAGENTKRARNGAPPNESPISEERGLWSARYSTVRMFRVPRA